MKAAFTRAYNKEVHLTPYSLQAVKKGRRGGGGESELGGEDADNDAQESEDDGLKADAMIKVRVLKFKLQCFQRKGCLLISVYVSPVFCFSLQQKKAKATKETKKEKKEASGTGKGKGTGKGTGKGKGKAKK